MRFCTLLPISILLFSASLSFSQERASLTDSEFGSLQAANFPPWQVEVDYLKAWTSGASVPALVSTSGDGTLRSQAGVLSQPTSSVLFGGDTQDDGDRSGGRFKISRELAFIDATLYATGLFIGEDPQSGSYRASSVGSPILARPFLDAQTGLENAQLVAFPGVLAGTVTVDTYSEFYGTHIGLANTLLRGTKGKMFVTSGYRFLSYRDQLSVREDLRSTDLGGAIPLDTTFVVRDSFETNNNFHGGTLGLGIESTLESWSYSIDGGVSLGGLTRRLQTSGETNVTVPTIPTTSTTGGLLALPSNIGSYRSTTFAAVPELNARLSRHIGSHLSADVGYTFLLLPKVWRAAEQIDRTINQSQIGGGALVGPMRPEHQATSHDMWVQALTFGVTAQW